MLQTNMRDVVCQIFQVISGNPQTEPVNGGCSDKGTDSNHNCTER